MLPPSGNRPVLKKSPWAGASHIGGPSGRFRPWGEQLPHLSYGWSEELHPRGYHGKWIKTKNGDIRLQHGYVKDLLASFPRMPGEPEFAWQGRVVDTLPKEVRHEVLFRVRERYPPVDFIAAGAARYRAEHGLPEPKAEIPKVQAPLQKADEVGSAFEATPDQAKSPRVKAAFDDFKRQNAEMFDFLTKPEAAGGLGIKVDFSPTSAGDPYPTAKAQAEDLRHNHHITIQSGLGGDHSLLTTEEYDHFRAVHDTFGHAGLGGGFDRHGEYQAWLQHMSMYTGAGRDAMSSEYHGVNTALWAGAPGTPGAGKAILLPENLILNPWDDQGNLVRKAGWTEGLHPRGYHGKWTVSMHQRGRKKTETKMTHAELQDAVKNLKKGQSIHLPNGTRVKRTRSGYRVTADHLRGTSRNIDTHRTPESAHRAAVHADMTPAHLPRKPTHHLTPVEHVVAGEPMHFLGDMTRLADPARLSVGVAKEAHDSVDAIVRALKLEAGWAAKYENSCKGTGMTNLRRTIAEATDVKKGTFTEALHLRGFHGRWIPTGGRRDFHHEGPHGEAVTSRGVPIHSDPRVGQLEEFASKFYHSPPAKMGRKQIQTVHELKNRLKDPNVPLKTKVKLAASLAFVAAQFSPLGIIPGDEILAGLFLHHAIQEAKGKESAPLSTKLPRGTIMAHHVHPRPVSFMPRYQSPSPGQLRPQAFRATLAKALPPSGNRPILKTNGWSPDAHPRGYHGKWIRGFSSRMSHAESSATPAQIELLRAATSAAQRGDIGMAHAHLDDVKESTPYNPRLHENVIRARKIMMEGTMESTPKSPHRPNLTFPRDRAIKDPHHNVRVRGTGATWRTDFPGSKPDLTGSDAWFAGRALNGYLRRVDPGRDKRNE